MYKKLRYFFRFSQALLSKYYWGIIIGLVVSALLYVTVPRLLPTLIRFNTHRRIGIIGRYSLPDLPPSIQQKVSIGLTSLDPSGLPSPGIASFWQATDSGRTYIFTLNTNLKWQDGTPLKSQDIKYSFQDASVEYPDSSRLIIRLKDPFSPLPAVVSRPVLKISKSLIRILPSRYIGLGSYKIHGFKKNGPYLTSVTLVPASVNSPLPPLTYNIFSSHQQARTALKLGLVDELEDLIEPGDLSSWPDLEVLPHISWDRYVGVFFNTQDPFFSGPSGRNLRLSLAYAADKDRWENRAYGPLPPVSWAYYPDLKKYTYDLPRAQELLSKVEKLPDNLVLSTVPTYLPEAEQLKKDWGQLGIKVSIQVTPDIPDEFQALLVAQAVPSDPDQYNLWHSTKDDTNLTNLKNPRIDKLLEDGRKIIDLRERLAIYQDFQKFLLDEAPAIFLYYPQSYLISRK